MYILTYYFIHLLLMVNGILNKNNVTIEIESLNSKNQTIKVLMGDAFSNGSSLNETTILTNGKATLNFSIDSPMVLYLNFGKDNYQMFMKPNGSYEVIVDFSKKDLGIRFGGDDATINNYIEEQKEDYRDYKYNNKHYYEWDISEFPIGIQKIDSLLNTKWINLNNSNKLLTEDKTFIENFNKANILSLKLNWYMFYFNPISPKSTEIPLEYRNIENQVFFDENLLRARVESYQIMLKLYFSIISAKHLLASGRKGGDINLDYYLKFTFNDIDKYEIPASIKEFLYAHLLMYTSLQETPKDFNVYIRKFQEKYPKSEYIITLNERLEKLNKLIKGKLATNIIGQTKLNKEIQLTDFSGKYVFIDFWATWCGPCVKELPFVATLQNKYKTNKNIVFLFVSIDQDRNKWKNYLSKHPEQNGIHINVDTETAPALRDAYTLYAIPRYVIVGKNGEIINASLPPPSTGVAEKLIIELLSSK